MSQRNNYTFGLPISATATAFASLPFEADHLRNVFNLDASQGIIPDIGDVCRAYHRSLSRKTLLATQQHLNLTLGQSMSNPIPELLALTFTFPSIDAEDLDDWALESDDTINQWLYTASKTTNPGFQGSRFAALIIHENDAGNGQITLLISRIAFFNDHRARLDHTLKNLPAACDISPLLQELSDNDFMDRATIHLHSINLD